MRRVVFVPAIFVAVALFTVAAGAAWLATGTGSSSSRSTNLGKPTAVAATATGTTSIEVTWQPPASTPAPSSYDVFRYNGASGVKVCTVAASSPRTCTSGGLSPGTTYGYTVEARLGANWLSGQTAQVNATTTSAPVGTPNFLVEQVVAGNKTAGTAFQVRITARTGTTTDTTYTGNKSLVFSGPGNNGSPYPNPAYPATGTFAAGVATVNVTLQKAETATLAVAEGSSRSGSTPVTVVAGVATHLKYTGSSHDCSGGSVFLSSNGATWSSKVTRYDASGNPAVGTGITVNVSRPNGSGGSGVAAAPQVTALTIPSGASETPGNPYSFGYTIQTGQPPAVTITAAASGLTSATCAVDR